MLWPQQEICRTSILINSGSHVFFIDDLPTEVEMSGKSVLNDSPDHLGVHIGVELHYPLAYCLDGCLQIEKIHISVVDAWQKCRNAVTQLNYVVDDSEPSFALGCRKE